MAHSYRRLVIVLNRVDLVFRENLQVTSTRLLLPSLTIPLPSQGEILLFIV